MKSSIRERILDRYFGTPPIIFHQILKNDDFTVLYVYEMKIWW